MKQGKLHYAWVISFAGLLIAGVVGIFSSTIGVFVKPVCEDLGFLRGQFSLYGSISMATTVALMPFFGALIKKFGFKRIAIISGLICSMILMGYSISSKLWHFYILAFVNGLFANGVGIMSVGILVNTWFMDKRGLATGIAFSGSGLLVAFLIPLANRFIELHGWRWTYRFLGCVALLILMPVILIIVKDKPENAGLEPYCINSNKEKNNQSNSNTDTGLTRNEALRAPMFWFLAIAVMGITLSQAGPHIHTVSFISDIGYSAAFASAIASAYFIFLTGFKVVMGIAFDRFGSFKGSMMIGGACALFPIFALLAGFPVFPWVYAFVLGLASSGATILGPVLTADYFGRKDFSRIYSLVSMFSYIGVTISSPLFGSIHDATGSYTPAWFFAMGMGIIVCVCLFGSHLARKKLTSKE